MMSDNNQITPIGVTTAALAGSAIGSAIPPTAKFIKKKLENTKVDTFTSKKMEQIKTAKNTAKSRIKNAWGELFPKNEAKKTVKHTKGFKGAIRKAKINTKLFAKKFINPALKQLKKPNVFFPILGAIAGAGIYVTANKNNNDF